MRKIFREPPPELQVRLNTPSIKRYEDHEAGLLNTIRELGIDDKALKQIFSVHQKESDALYGALSVKEKDALEDECEIESFNEDLSTCIENIWMSKQFPENVSNVDEENQMINIIGMKYVYPNYVDLVGGASEEDFEFGYCRHLRSEGNRLTIERKSELLLLGAFRWNGLCIAKYYDPDKEYDLSKGWLVSKDPKNIPSNMIGAKYSNDIRYSNICFSPLEEEKTQWLHELLIDSDAELGNRPLRKKFQRIRFKDGNPYNCLPDNLVVREARGRKMKCQGCGEETWSDQSLVIRDGKEKLRYCFSCLKN